MKTPILAPVDARDRTAFLAGFQAGKSDAQTHPGGYQDPWEGGHGSRAELAFETWRRGFLPQEKAS